MGQAHGAIIQHAPRGEKARTLWYNAAMPSPPARRPRPRLPGRPPWAADALALLALLGFALALTAPVLSGLTPVPTDALPRFGTLSALGGAPRKLDHHRRRAAVPAVAGVRAPEPRRRRVAAVEPGPVRGYPFLGNAQNQLYYPIPGCLAAAAGGSAFAVSAPLRLLAGRGRHVRLSRASWARRAAACCRAGLRRQRADPHRARSRLGGRLAVWLPWVAAAAEMALGGGAPRPGRRARGSCSACWRCPGTRRGSSSAACSGAVAGRARAGAALATARAPRAPTAGARRAGGAAPWRSCSGPTLAAIPLLPFGEMLGLSSRAGQAFRVPSSFDRDCAR